VLKKILKYSTLKLLINVDKIDLPFFHKVNLQREHKSCAGVNFTNLFITSSFFLQKFCATFLYLQESISSMQSCVLGSKFFGTKILYGKHVRKMLMKLTTVWHFNFYAKEYRRKSCSLNVGEIDYEQQYKTLGNRPTIINLTNCRPYFSYDSKVKQSLLICATDVHFTK